MMGDKKRGKNMNNTQVFSDEASEVIALVPVDQEEQAEWFQDILAQGCELRGDVEGEGVVRAQDGSIDVLRTLVAHDGIQYKEGLPQTRRQRKTFFTQWV